MTRVRICILISIFKHKEVPEVEVCELLGIDRALQAVAAAPAEDEIAPLEVSVGIAGQEIAVPTLPGAYCIFISSSTSSFLLVPRS